MFLYPLRHPEEPQLDNDCWKTYVVSPTRDGTECDFLNQIAELDDVFIEDFFAWLLQFKKLCAAHPKRPMNVLVPDENKLHSVGSAKITGKDGVVTDEKVWQFTHNRIRVMWCYAGDGRVIILGRVVIKKQQKTKPADVKVAANALQAYHDAKAAGKLKVVTGDENEQAQ